MEKKVLIIAYYWPPAGGPGVQRWLNFTRHLLSYGVQPVVVVPEDPHYPIQDPQLLQEVDPGVRVIKRPIREPYRLASYLGKEKTTTISKGIIETKEKSLISGLLLAVRANLFIPDARFLWVKPMVSFLEKFLVEEGIDTIITTGPPHSLHLIGLELKNRMKLRWIADFRDPWTNIGYHHKMPLLPFARKRHHDLERRVLGNADHVLTTSYQTQREFREITEKPITVITNGYEPVDLPEIALDDRFSLAHIGSLLSDRNPEVLWQALSELKQEEEGFAGDLKIILAGVYSEEVLQRIRDFGLNDQLVLKGYLSHQQALVLQRSVRLLLLLEIDADYTRGIIPGKLFEYMASNRPVLAIGPDHWDAAQLLGEYKAGKSYGYRDLEGIKKEILRQYKAYKLGEANPTGVDPGNFTRHKLTGDLAGIIKENAWE